jgi:hypothetical protein
MPNTPGALVLTGSGKLAVTADGKLRVYNAAGECPECCGGLTIYVLTPCECNLSDTLYTTNDLSDSVDKIVTIDSADDAICYVVSVYTDGGSPTLTDVTVVDTYDDCETCCDDHGHSEAAGNCTYYCSGHIPEYLTLTASNLIFPTCLLPSNCGGALGSSGRYGWDTQPVEINQSFKLGPMTGVPGVAHGCRWSLAQELDIPQLWNWYDNADTDCQTILSQQGPFHWQWNVDLSDGPESAYSPAILVRGIFLWGGASRAGFRARPQLIATLPMSNCVTGSFSNAVDSCDMRILYGDVNYGAYAGSVTVAPF